MKLRSTLAVLALGLLSSGYGLWQSRADDPKPAMKVKSLAETTAVLHQPCGLTEAFHGSLGELFDQLGDRHGVTVRLDPHVFNQNVTGVAEPYNRKIQIERVKGLSVLDLLNEVIGQLGGEQYGLSARGGQIVVGNRFQPAAIPGRNRTGEATVLVPEGTIAQTIFGPGVHVATANQSLTEVVAMLREQTGANIVIDPAIKEAAKTQITITLNDVKLLTVLKIAGDMCEVAPAVVDNVFYITTREKAAEMMAETERNLFGTPPTVK
jgi:hypothetical protein